ncbi:MAG TPA: hypothetical protein DDW52_15165 [Planctomycetaceae bacterium]|nr:hypothetical protein [Planctomycetaceae bacterium]
MSPTAQETLPPPRCSRAEFNPQAFRCFSSRPLLCWKYALSLVLLGALPFAVSQATAQAPDADQAISTFPDSVWFDAETDGYRSPRTRELHDNPIRNDGFRNNSKQRTWSEFWESIFDWDWNWDWGGAGGGAMTSFFDSKVFTFLVYAVVTLIILLLLGFLVWFLLRDALPNFRQKTAAPKRIEIDPAKVADLPFDAKPDMGDPLSAAKAFMNSEEFDKAIVYLYGYMLLALDQQNHLYLQKGKTNRMYLNEIGSLPLRDTLQPVQRTFESSFFGKHAVSRESFMEHWSTLEAFHQLVSEPAVRPQTSRDAKPAIGVAV